MYMNINEFKLFLIRSIVWTSMRPKWQYNGTKIFRKNPTKKWHIFMNLVEPKMCHFLVTHCILKKSKYIIHMYPNPNDS